ncbi:MAG: DUF2270 domain-containing protein [Roseibium sp.]|uniref:DUF2270 domain-containing protein n=1 Tax=Roseibium sp. TaxID=1936156 RepID=UPI00262D2DBE|nr:DUF2270 domain-containing protein [Roseibium sp.]MCV0424547.1 DUF2270 domain-containing protein [Roseibium sp.]
MPGETGEKSVDERLHQDMDSGTLGALAHLYRAEVFRSTHWRTRLDNTTNWAVVTTGIALSATFSNRDASPLPMVLVGLLVTVFLIFEARRYRYYNMFRARARLLESDFYAPILHGHRLSMTGNWSTLLADDYEMPHYHISLVRAAGRRLRSNYSWILAIQAVAYYGKIAIHPVPLTNIAEAFERAAIGPIPGSLVMLAGVGFHVGWVIFAIVTLRLDQIYRAQRQSPMQQV